jgi:excinuclease ABC subunit A
LGPEGGDEGGEVIVQGTPEKVAETQRLYTGLFLKEALGNQKGYRSLIAGAA